MKATLEFDLREEQSEFDEAVNGHKYKRVLWEMNYYLREQAKYHADSYTDKQLDLLIDLREYLWNCISEAGVELE